MGFFSRRFLKNKAEQENKSSPALEDFNGENPPITGGNSFETKQVLKAQDSINKNTIPSKVKINRYTQKITNFCYNFYWLLNFHANYFVSVFPVKTKDAKMNELIYNCFRVHFMYGACGIFKKGDLTLGVYEKRVHYNNLGEIKSIEFAYLNDLLGGKQAPDFKKLKTAFTIGAEELEKSYARLRTNSIGFGAITTWMPFVKQQESLLKKIYMYSFVFHRKISYKAADLSTSTEELDMFFNEDVPFYLELDADLGTGNRFTAESINGSGGSGVAELETYYNMFIETYYHLLGRRINLDDKKERNVSVEVNSSQSNFDILQNEDRICKEDFLNKMTEITGVQWEEIKQEPINPMGEDNDNKTDNEWSDVSGTDDD